MAASPYLLGLPFLALMVAGAGTQSTVDTDGGTILAVNVTNAAQECK